LTKLEEPESNRVANQRCPNSWSRFAMAAATWLLLLQGCSQTEVKGTYDVEIEIVRATAAIGGTLILSTGILDVPALTNVERATAGDWLESDTIDANSCFVLRNLPDAAPAHRNRKPSVLCEYDRRRGRSPRSGTATSGPNSRRSFGITDPAEMHR